MPNPVNGTSGDDVLYGTYGSDIFHPGANIYGDTIYDPGGDDYYVLTSGQCFITDAGGTDTVILEGYEFEDLNFMIIFDHAVSIGTDDYAVGAWFENMVNNPSGGIEYLVLDDVTLTRTEILYYAEQMQGW